MQIYTLEIPGRKHGCCEDSCYVAQVNSRDRDTGEVGVVVVGDGLSGYEGTRASHEAVKMVGEYITDKIRGNGTLHIDEFIRDSIIAANSQLSGRSKEMKTTLDVVVVEEKKEPWLAHLGDGRIYAVGKGRIIEQLSVDESDGLRGPSNYLGQRYILSRSIEERINLSKLNYQPEAFIIATDGLRSRVGEHELKEIVKRHQDHPQALLSSIGEAVMVPQQKIRSLPEQTKRDLAMMIEEQIAAPISKTEDYSGSDSDSQHTSNYGNDESEDMKSEKNENQGNCRDMSTICQAYEQGNHEKLNETIDRLIPFDDVTVVYVDLGDIVGQKLERVSGLEMRVTSNEVEIERLNRQYTETENKHNALQEEVTSFKDSVNRTLRGVGHKDTKPLTRKYLSLKSIHHWVAAGINWIVEEIRND